MRTSDRELTAESLMEEAARRAGSDAWGDPAFAGAVELLLAGCRERGALTPLGGQVLRSIVLRHLRNRLLVEAFARAHPGVDRRPLAGAIVVTGLPRTGTTALHALIALDPEGRFLALWEALRPLPPDDDAQRAERIGQAGAWLERFYELVPGFRAIHALTADGPEECDALLQNSFASQHLDDMFDAPAYSAWLLHADLAFAYEHYALALRVLDAPRPRPSRWVLKSPLHVAHLDALLGVLDGATVVHCHRAPADAVSSYASLVATLRGAYCTAVSPRAVGRQALERCATALTRALAARDRLAGAAFVDVFHGDVVADPVAVVRRVYERIGREVSGEHEARMRRWVAGNPVGRHGEHRHAPADFGLDGDEVTAAFAPYAERFAGVLAPWT